MKKGEKTTRTQHIEKIATFFDLEKRTVELKLKEETKISNIYIKKAFWSLENGLPHYDMNEIIREVSIEIAELTDKVCRFMLVYNTDYDSNTKQSLECMCNGKNYFTKRSGVEGINDILFQIGVAIELYEPITIFNLVVWK
jgi:hypothetical protein